MFKAVHRDFIVRVIGRDDHHGAQLLVLEKLAIIGKIPFHSVLLGGGTGALLDDVDGVAKLYVGITRKVGKVDVVRQSSAAHYRGYDFSHNFLSLS